MQSIRHGVLLLWYVGIVWSTTSIIEGTAFLRAAAMDRATFQQNYPTTPPCATPPFGRVGRQLLLSKEKYLLLQPKGPPCQELHGLHLRPCWDDTIRKIIVLPVLLLFVLCTGLPTSTGATGYGASGASMSPPRDVWSTTTKPDIVPSSSGSSRIKSQEPIIRNSLRDDMAILSLEDLSQRLDDSTREKNRNTATEIKNMDPRPLTLTEQALADKLAQSLLREEFVERLEAQPYWFDYGAAFLGSVGSTLIMHPLDTIKTRLQVRGMGCDGNHRSLVNGTETRSVAAATTEVPELLTDNLYQGLTGNIWKEGPSSALSLSVYEFVKLGLLRATAVTAGSSTAGRFAVSRFQVYLLAGAAGELVGSVLQAPAEVVKSLLQSRKAKSPSQALGMVVEQPEGVVRAWSAAIWRDVPFSAIQLAVFEMIKAYILNHPEIFNGFDSTTLTAEAMIGALAGGFGALLTNPSDVVTARIITQQHEEPIAEKSQLDLDSESTNVEIPKKEEPHPIGVGQMVQQIYVEGGPAAFFAGWQARVAYMAPGVSIFLTTYCSIRQAGIEYHWFD